MATREEMGKALRGFVEETSDLRWQRYGDWWGEVAERFAAWLEANADRPRRKQEPERRAYHDLWEENAQAQWMRLSGCTCLVERAASDPACPHHATMQSSTLTCPKGHVLTHREDIEKRYCGICREYL